MKNLLLTTIFSSITLICLSQKNIEHKMSIIFDDEPIGINLKTNQKIPSKRIHIEKLFSSIYYDSINHVILALVKEYENDGPFADLIAIDLKSSEILWQKELNLKKNNFSFDENILVFEEGKNLYTHDILTFEKKWEIPSKLYGVFTDYKIGLTMNKSFWQQYKDGLMGIDLHTGNVKWTNENIKLKKGFNYKTFVKDSFFYFINDKFYGLNVKTGQHWESEFQFYKDCSNYSYYGYCPYCSNFAFDSFYFYIANENAIIKYDYYGKLISEMRFPNMVTASMSKLYINDSTLIIVNKGFTVLGNYKVNTFETPFVAIYTKTGENKAFIPLIDEDILKSDIVHNELFLYQKKALHIIDIQKGEHIFSKEVPKKKMKTWIDIIEAPFYQQVGNQFNYISPTDSSKLFLLKMNDKIDIVDKEFNELGVISEDSTHYIIAEDSLFEAIFNLKNKTTTLINNSKEKIVELFNVQSIFKRNERVFIVIKNRIYIIKLIDLL